MSVTKETYYNGKNRTHDSDAQKTPCLDVDRDDIQIIVGRGGIFQVKFFMAM